EGRIRHHEVALSDQLVRVLAVGDRLVASADRALEAMHGEVDLSELRGGFSAPGLLRLFDRPGRRYHPAPPKRRIDSNAPGQERPGQNDPPPPRTCHPAVARSRPSSPHSMPFVIIARIDSGSGTATISARAVTSPPTSIRPST